jgi:hypothetical protein
MKLVRIFFLLLLAVLLPIRGAVAAAMLCPVGGTGSQTEVRVHDHSIGHHQMDQVAEPDHSMRDHDHGSAVDASEASDGAPDKCDLCSAYCSVLPLVGSLPTTFVLPEVAATTFPALSVRAPSFVSDGPERPPRSI